jgi:hypothetical protein
MKKLLFLLTVVLFTSCFNGYQPTEKSTSDCQLTIDRQLELLNRDSVLIQKRVPITLQGSIEHSLNTYESNGESYFLKGEYLLYDYANSIGIFVFGIVITIIFFCRYI